MKSKIQGSVPLWTESMPTIDIKPILKDYFFMMRPFLRRKSKEIPSLEPFILPANHGTKNPCIIVAPGGGYMMKADHEGKPIAQWLNSIGISSCILYYRNAPNRHPIPILDAQRAIRLVRAKADLWNIDPEKIGMLGFSAGGHLAATAATIGQHDYFLPGYNRDHTDEYSAKLNLSILCYPVISMLKHTHSGSKKNLIGSDPDSFLETLLSPHLQVTENTPPTFIWTTEEDQAVPCINSQMYADALDKKEIDYKIVIFEHGRHGLGLASKILGVSDWPKLCEEWMKKIGFLSI